MLSEADRRANYGPNLTGKQARRIRKKAGHVAATGRRYARRAEAVTDRESRAAALAERAAAWLGRGAAKAVSRG